MKLLIEDRDGYLSVVDSKKALIILDEYWDNLYNFAWVTKYDSKPIDINPTSGLGPQSESSNDLRFILYELAKNAKLEMKRGNKGAIEELLRVFIESGEKFSTFEKKLVVNDKGSNPLQDIAKGYPL